MKKIIKSRLFIIVITMIICISGTLYAANKYQASEVVYNTSDGKTMNIGEALDNLYSDYNSLKKKGNATANQILKGKTAIVNGSEITGKMNNLSNINVWVNTDNGKFDTNANYTYSDGSKTSNALVFHSNNNGYMNNSTNFIFGDSNEIANMIKSGSKFLGVTGKYTKDATATAGDILSGKTAYVNGKKVTGTLEQKNSISKITQLTYSNSNQNTKSTVTASKSYTFTQDYSNVQITSFIAAGNGASDISGNSVTVQVNNGTAKKSTVVSSGQSYTFLSSSVAVRVAHIAYTHNLTNIKSGDVVKINYSVSYPSGGTQAHFDSIIYGT